MRRLVIPVLVGLAVCLLTQGAYGQISLIDTIGFKDTLRDKPGDTVEIPIYLSTDSAVSGISLNFSFNPDVLWPILLFDQQFADSLLLDPALDSSEYRPLIGPNLRGDSGLWYMEVRLSPTALLYLQNFSTFQVPYNMNTRNLVTDTAAARFLLYPGFDSVKTIPGRLGPGGTGIAIAYLKFRVNPTLTIPADLGRTASFRVVRQTSQFTKTELAEEWYDPATAPVGSNGYITKAIDPSLRNSIFVVDTAGGGGGPGPNANDLPIVAGISPSVYNIKQGDLVSFTVSATDAEGGTLRLYANRNSTLPANATFTPNNPAVGSGGNVSGVFSFQPSITQEGTFSFTFQAQDDSGAFSAIQSVTVIVAELEIDRLFTSSAVGANPQGGVPGLNEVLVPINIVTKKMLYGIQFDLNYDADNFKLDSIIPTDRMPNWVIYDNIGASPGFLRVVAFGLANDTLLTGSSSAVMNLAFTVDPLAQVGCYPIDIYNAWESIDPDPDVPSLEFTTDSGEVCVDRHGDVNLDQRIDVADLVNVVGSIIGNFTLNRRQFATADIVIDANVNVVDLVAIINTIFGNPISPAPVQNFDQNATLNLSHPEIPTGGTQAEMALQADMPTGAAGVQLEIQYNPSTVEMQKPLLAEGSEGFRINYSDNGAGKMSVLLYSMRPWNDNELIPTGLSQILTLPFLSKAPISVSDDRQVRITQAYISTGAAKNVPVDGLPTEPPLPNRFSLYQNRPNPFNPNTVIDFYINGADGFSTEQARLDIYNIVGQHVKTLIDAPLAPGQYSVEWDGTDGSGARMASGVYLYRLKVSMESQTKKMVLLK